MLNPIEKFKVAIAWNHRPFTGQQLHSFDELSYTFMQWFHVADPSTAYTLVTEGTVYTQKNLALVQVIFSTQHCSSSNYFEENKMLLCTKRIGIFNLFFQSTFTPCWKQIRYFVCTLQQVEKDTWTKMCFF